MAQTEGETLVTGLCSTCPIAARGCAVPVYPKFHVPNADGELKYLLLGEAPGFDELKKGQPFVGKSGSLLRELLEKANVDINDTLISNTTWCAPRDTPEGKLETPKGNEAQHCLPHALHYVRLYRPKVIVALGNVPYEALCLKSVSGQKGKGITKVHGKWLSMNLTVAARYSVAWMWAAENQRSMVWTEKEEEQEGEIEILKGQGYDETWLETPVFPVVHPSYVLPNGRGRQEEMLYFDLVKLRAAVEGTEGGKTLDESRSALSREGLDEALQKYRWINSIEEWEAYVEETLKFYQDGAIQLIAVDIETTSQEMEGLDKPEAGIGLLPYDPRTQILCIQFSRFKDEGVAVMVSHEESNFNEPVVFSKLRAGLKRLCETIPLIGHNMVFDAHTLKTFLGIDKIKVVGDTMLMDHWLNAGTKLSHTLDDLGARYISAGMQHKQCYLDWQHAHPDKSMADAPLDILLAYAAGDTDVTLQVYYALRAYLQKEGRFDAYYELHHGIHHGWNVVNDLEHSGMRVQRDVLDHLAEIYPKRLDTCHQEILKHMPIVEFMQGRLNKENAKRQKINDEITANKNAGVTERRRIRKIYTYEEWTGNRKNWFNPNSWQQILELWSNIIQFPYHLVEDLGYNDTCPRCKRDKCKCKGEKYVNKVPKTDEHNRDVLRKISHYWASQWEGSNPDHARNWRIVAAMMDQLDEYKMLSKMNGTYVQGIYPLIVDKPGASDAWDPRERCFYLYRDYAKFPPPWTLHPSYLMHGTETGRLSSRNPNGQNFPKEKMDPNANVKLPYISRWAGEGGIILQPDYSQIEVRVMVMLCQDERIAAQINEGKDIHKVVASMVHNVPYEKVTKDLRGPCKRITFGILYGQSIGSLAQALQIPYKDAKALQDKFFAQLPKVKAFVDQCVEDARRDGMVRTMFDRIRYLPDINNATDDGKRSYAERCAVNTKIQSPASDMCWSAYGRAWRRVQEVGIEAYPYSIVHDSQAFDCAPGRFMDVAELQYYHMVYEPYELWDWITVKPEADFDIGAGWGRLVSMKVGFDDEQNPNHNEVAFYGPKDDVGALVKEVSIGNPTHILEDKPHPDEEEAKKGMWWTKVHVERPDPMCWLEGRKLITRS